MLNKIQQLYKDLQKKHGHPLGQWTLWCKRPKTTGEREEVIIGAILTQNTNWKNVSLAIAELKKRKCCDLTKIWQLAEVDMEKLQRLIRSAGFFRSKAIYLKETADFILKNGGVKGLMKMPTAELREVLLKIKGIGPETADSILLYALDKPSFVVDEYTRRSARENKLAGKFDYNHLKQLFEDNLPSDYEVYQDFHALMVIEEKSKVWSQKSKVD